MSDLEKALAMCRDEVELPQIINSDYGIGYTFTDEDGHECVTSLGLWTNERVLCVDITHYNFTHYYGVIWFSSPYCYNTVTGRTTKRSLIRTLLPLECEGGSIEVVRPVTEGEIKRNPQRWDLYDAGDITNAFKSKEDLVETVNFIIKNRFTGKWIVRMNM
jgi:hypothetical protein